MKKRKFSEHGSSNVTLTMPSTLCKETSPLKERGEMAVTPVRRGQQGAVSANEVRQQCILMVLWQMLYSKQCSNVLDIFRSINRLKTSGIIVSYCAFHSVIFSPRLLSKLLLELLLPTPLNLTIVNQGKFMQQSPLPQSGNNDISISYSLHLKLIESFCEPSSDTAC